MRQGFPDRSGSSFIEYRHERPMGYGSSGRIASLIMTPAHLDARISKTILLVEDEEPVRTVTRCILESAGYHVLEAARGSDALHVIAHMEQRVHLLLTDVVMPGMSGKELADRLTLMQPEAATLYISGYLDDGIMRYGVTGQGSNFLAKPFTPDELLHRVQELLNTAETDEMPALSPTNLASTRNVFPCSRHPNDGGCHHEAGFP
jgi:CheY-like chemotaxis protein